MQSKGNQKGKRLCCLGGAMAAAGLGLLLLVWQVRFVAGVFAGLGMAACLYGWMLLHGSAAWLRWSLLGAVLFWLVSFAAAAWCILTAMRTEVPAGQPVLLVLGAKVNGTHLSETLQDRIHTAQDYLQDNPEAVVVVSGGRGPGETVSEAEAMRQYLESQGIAAERILAEERSRTTDENMRFSREMLQAAGIPCDTVLVVTSDYHLFRAQQLAARYFGRVSGLPARSRLSMRLNYMVREYFALGKMLWERH